MKAVVVLEVMWDWRNCAGSAGYRERAPRHFDINPLNYTGSRLHRWLLPQYPFRVTNACPQLVSSARGRGTPDREWLAENLRLLAGFELLLVCGKVAQATYDFRSLPSSVRVIEMPHPAARGFWNGGAIQFVRDEILNGMKSVRIIKSATCKAVISEPLRYN